MVPPCMLVASPSMSCCLLVCVNLYPSIHGAVRRSSSTTAPAPPVESTYAPFCPAARGTRAVVSGHGTPCQRSKYATSPLESSPITTVPSWLFARSTPNHSDGDVAYFDRWQGV